MAQKDCNDILWSSQGRLLGLLGIDELPASLDEAAADIPARATDWRSVIEFAATFDPQSELPNGAGIAGVADIVPNSTIPEMRLALYAEWRRHNHFGREPDQATMELTQAVLEQLRAATA
jgi:hypothetical protein